MSRALSIMLAAPRFLSRHARVRSNGIKVYALGRYWTLVRNGSNFATRTHWGEAKVDDLEAVRKIIEVLGEFETEEQQRIVRWSLEKLELTLHKAPAPAVVDQVGGAVDPSTGSAANQPVDIKTFYLRKNPSSDNQFATFVAYYYAFEAPPEQRKGTIGPSDLTDSCRMVGRARPGDPAKTLRNATAMGYLDNLERGAFKINTVGENLVAMTLPAGANDSLARPTRSPRKKKTVKKVVKKTSQKAKGAKR